MCASKKIVKAVAIIIIVSLLAIGGVVTFFVTTIDQSMIKKKATELVYNKTGRNLKIEGDVGLTFFPWLGVKIQKISLSNPTNFKHGNFIQADEIGVSVKLLPLILGRVEAKNLIIKNLDLNLIKNRAGKNNWEGLSKTNNKQNNQTPSTTKNHLYFSKFTIANVMIDGGNILWQNHQTGKKIKITQLNLDCKKVTLDEPFAVTISFYIPGFQPSLDLKIKADTRVTLSVDKKLYLFKNIKLTGFLKNKHTGQSHKFSADTAITVDLRKEQFFTDKTRLHIANTNITGSLKAKNIINKPTFSGYLAIDDLNTKEIIQLVGTNKSVKDKLHLSRFSTQIAGNSDVINFQKIKFDFYEGKAVGNAKIYLRNPAPQFNLKLKLENISMKPLLIDLAKYEKFSGKLSLDTNITTIGNKAEEMLQNLNGGGKVLLTNGSYRGVDIPYEVRHGHAILNRKEMPQKPSDPHTDFDRLTMSFNINRGVLNTNDLLILAPDYRVTGKGDANLTTNNLNLSVSAYSNHDKNFLVPIKITGSFTDPSIRPDLAVIIKETIIKGVGKIIKKQLERNIIPEKLKQLIPNGLFQ